MPSTSSTVELMQRYFPKCPICGSEKGYVPSVFYPNVKCKSCQAEWLLYKDGMELKGASRDGWDNRLLNKMYPFEFWKKLKKEDVMSLWEGVLPLEKEEYVFGNWRIELKKGGKKMFKGEAFDRVVLTNRRLAFLRPDKLVGGTYSLKLSIPLESIKAMTGGGIIVPHLDLLTTEGEYRLQGFLPGESLLGGKSPKEEREIFREKVFQQVKERRQELERKKTRARMQELS